MGTNSFGIDTFIDTILSPKFIVTINVGFYKVKLVKQSQLID